MKNLLLTFIFLYTYIANAQSIESRAGLNVSFDGIDDYIDLGDVQELNFDVSDTFSISLWIKLPPASSGIDEIITKAGGPSLKGWGLQIRDGKAEFFMVSDFASQSWYFIQSNLDLRDSQWHHIGFSHNGAANANSDLFFIDGKSSSTQILANTLNGSTINPGLAYIGHYDGNNQMAGPEWFLGEMDELKVYSEIRTKSDFRMEMHIAAKNLDPELISYWQFNNSSADSIYDLTGSLDGRIYGGVQKKNSEIDFGEGQFQEWQETSGLVQLDSIAMSFDYSIFSNTEVYLSRIDALPDSLPPNNGIPDSSYFIIYSEGQLNNLANLSVGNLKYIDSLDALAPCSIHLNRRDDQNPDNWLWLFEADSIDFRNEKAHFEVFNLQGTYLITRLACITSLEKEKSSGIQIKPNPFNEHIEIANVASLKEVIIMDSQCKVVWKTTERKIDTSALKTGLYYIKVINEDGTFFKRIIKQ